MKQYGTIKIHFKELFNKTNMSQNQFLQEALLEHAQFTRYMEGTVTRLDIDVLARICTALDCKIEDLLEFVPNDQHSPNE